MISKVTMIFSLLEKKELHKFFVSIFLSILAAGLELTAIYIVFNWVSIITEKSQYYLSLEFGFIIVILAGCTRLLAVIYNHRFSLRLDNIITVRLIEKLLTSDYIELEKIGVGGLLKSTFTNTRITIYEYVLPITSLISAFFLILFMIIGMVLVNPVVTMYFLIFVSFLYGLYSLIFRAIITRLSKVRNDAESEKEILANDLFQGLTELITFNVTKSWISKIYKVIQRHASSRIKILNIANSPRIIFETIILFGLLVWFANTERADIIRLMPTITGLAGILLRLVPAMQRLYTSLTQIRSADPYVKEVLSVIKSDLKVREVEESLLSSFDSITLDKVSIGYDDLLIAEIDLKINVGDRLVIRGASGSGKSTLLKALIGLSVPTSGEILLDEEIPVTGKGLLPFVSYVKQSPHIFNLTLAENISMDLDRNYDLVLINELLTQFGLDSIPHNYQLNSASSNLSGGQKQRIAVARAVYGEKKLLVFDEPTTGLDLKSVKRFNQIINSLDRSWTVILATHDDSCTLEGGKELIIENRQLKKT